MDITSVGGLMVGAFFVLFGAIGGPKMQFDKIIAFVDIPSMAIVGGGALGAVLICLPLEVFLEFPKVIMKVFFVKSTSPNELIEKMVHYAEIARRDGILALESETENIEDPFLLNGIQMAVDGTDPDLIFQIMTIELENLEQRHANGKTMLDLATKYAPAWGMIGTVMGLVLMLLDLDPETIGPNMAVALITTFYGAVLSNLLVGPLGDKLAIRSAQEVLVMQIILKGVMSIQTGDNPRIVEQKLNIFLPPKLRKTEEEA